MLRILISAVLAVAAAQAQNAADTFKSGKHYFEVGDYPNAVKALATAASRNPDLPGLQSLYGSALLNTGDSEAAAHAFQLALSANPNDFEANLAMGQIWISRRGFSEAKPLIEQAVHLRPGSPAAKLAFSECLLAQREFTQARRYAESAVLALPNSSESHQVLAAVYFGLGMKQEADSERELAASLAPLDAGPQVNEIAPDFRLPEANSNAVVHLDELRTKHPVVLVFGSYTCPNFRASAAALRNLAGRYRSRATFLLVYIREAHAITDWQSTRNTRDGINLTPATTRQAQNEHALMCSRKLHLPFRAVVDGLNGKTEAAYNAWPSRVFIINTDRRIAFSTRLTELDFHPEKMEFVLRHLAEFSASRIALP